MFFLRVLLNDHYLGGGSLVFLYIVAARVNLKDEKICMHQGVGSWYGVLNLVLNLEHVRESVRVTDLNVGKQICPWICHDERSELE